MHFWLAAERQIAIARGHSRNDPVEGCDDLAITRRLFETEFDMWTKISSHSSLN